MPLTPDQVKELERERSNYGCGADTCKSCYPVQYSCAYCLEELPQPIANGEIYECEECGWLNNAEYAT